MHYRLLSYASVDGARAGVLFGDRLYDAGMLSENSAYSTVRGILDDWEAADGLFASACPGDGGMPLASVTLLAPVLYPGQIWAAGANYQDHIDEMGEAAARLVPPRTAPGSRPWFYSKSARSAVVGPGSVNPLPTYSDAVDWEIELAVVIGRTASRVGASSALDHVAGYTIANDLSARDWLVRQEIDPVSPFRYDWLSLKGFNGACPMGPWIVPASQIPDPQVLAMKLWVDGELMQDSSTRHMIYSIAELIEEISARTTLYPGDVILTGTPSGVGVGRGLFLKPGQEVALWIEGIGELRHGFAAAGDMA